MTLARRRWRALRAQSYVETGPHGLYPHDVVREVLVAETTWREPQVAGELRTAIRRRALRRCRDGDGTDRERALLDVLFSLRYDPAARTYYDWDTFGAVVADLPRPSDQEGLRELVEQDAGEGGAAAILPWLDEQPGGVGLYRNRCRRPHPPYWRPIRLPRRHGPERKTTACGPARRS